jgi:hypothetical protein
MYAIKRKRILGVVLYYFIDRFNKQPGVFCFGFFHVVVLVLLAKQQQQRIVNFNTISVSYAWALKSMKKYCFNIT